MIMRVEDALTHRLGRFWLLVWLFEGYVLENDLIKIHCFIALSGLV